MALAVVWTVTLLAWVVVLAVLFPATDVVPVMVVEDGDTVVPVDVTRVALVVPPAVVVTGLLVVVCVVI